MAARKLRILLVDDEIGILKTVGKRLEVAGFEVITAKDGNDALAKARAEQPDGIILDLMMPERDGFEACGLLKQDEKLRNIPIVIFSGKNADDTEGKCLALGANAYVSKAHGAATLIDRLTALLSHRSS